MDNTTAINMLKMRNLGVSIPDDVYEFVINSLEELEQYRAIGTVEECREARERQRVKDIIHNPDSGVDEDWLCPTCGKFCSPYSKHCQNCGQSVKVGNAP